MNNQLSIDAWLSENNITEVEAIIADMNGIARGKIVPARKFSEERGIRVPESLFLQTVSGAYAAEWVVEETEPDIYARPDPRSIRLIPWYTDPTAVVIHDCYYADGSPVETAPRHVLQRVLALYHERGWEPVVAPELEFYLVKPNLDSDYPLEPPAGRSGRAESGRQSFSIDALNEFDPLFEDIDDYCAVQGLDIDTLTHEYGAAQMEVNLLHGNPLDLADQAFLFKRTVREAAHRHKIYATFMAKPMEDEPGSSMHVHTSVVDQETRQNIFSDADGKPSQQFFNFIGGQQRHIPALMAIFAPNVNSYRRLQRHLSAPINVQWGYDNRTVGLRIPNSSPDALRVENRLAGADANPYLAIAASLAAGYLGLVHGDEPTKPLSDSAYDLPHDLPRTLLDSIKLLGENELVIDILGERFVRAYNSVKRGEYDAFMNVISSWEREHLLLNV